MDQTIESQNSCANTQPAVNDHSRISKEDSKAEGPRAKDIEKSIDRMLKRASGEKDETVKRDGTA